MKFHSPYQFIALKPASKKSKTEYKNDKNENTLKNSNYVRHDRWHKNGLSGSIHCTLTTASPLVVGAEQTTGTKNHPGCVTQYHHPNGGIAIPANSLRGMISSIAETLSNSSLRVLASKEDSTYTVRNDSDNSKVPPFKNLGVLYKEGDDFYLFPLKKNKNVIDNRSNNLADTTIIKKQKCFQNKDPMKQFVYVTGISSNIKFSDQPGAGKVQGVLYIRNNYKKWQFIPWDGEINKEQRFKVTQQIINFTDLLQSFHDKKNPCQQHPKGYHRDFDNNSEIVKEGDLLYYKENTAKDTITELSYSQIWRRPVEGNLYGAIQRTVSNDTLPWNIDRNHLTAAESLFGVVEEEFDEKKGARNLASRLQFTDATSKEKIELKSCITLKILDSPKPPSPAMYFNSGGKNHLAKKDLDLNKHTPMGRKHYLPHKEPNENPHWETNIPKNQSGKNWKQHLNCRPIPVGAKFEFKIHFENLSPAELGLLQTAISPSKGETPFMHRLGLGKPLGLGQIILKVTEIETIDRTKRYSLEGINQSRSLNLDLKKDDPDASLIDQESLGALLTLYNPDNIKAPVCYPFMGNKAYAEDKGFDWFVANEKKQSNQRQGLTPIAAGKKIPVLKS